MAAATFFHFDALLGTDLPTDCAINLQQLIETANLEDLDAPSGEDEIWQVVKRLSTRIAPGPDRFTVEFLPSC